MLEYGAVTEPRWLNADKTVVLCKVVFPHLGEEPVAFGATADDDMEHGRQIFADLTAGKYGKIAPYVAPQPHAPAIRDAMTDVAFFAALAKAGHITEAEALAAVKAGELPAKIVDAIKSLSEADRFDADMYLSGSTALSRHNPSVAKVLHLAFDLDDAGVAALFAA